MNERHRMDTNMLDDDKLHAREPDPVIGQHCGVVGELGIAEIDHDRGAWTGQRPRCNSGYLVWQFAVVYLADFAIGAADRYDPSGREFLDRACCADYRRHAQLARDNGGMASASAVAGD